MPARDATAPSPWVTRFAAEIPAGGRVLDLACGGGRHTRLLLVRGHPVTAVDRDPSQLGPLATDTRVRTVRADLEAGPWPLADEPFAGVVVTHYLWRPILPAIASAVAPGGVLIYDTFALGQERLGRPTNPDYLMRPDELLALVRDRFQVRAYEHGPTSDPRPAMRSRICARATGH